MVPRPLVAGVSSEAVLGPRADHATPGPSALVHRHACVGVTGGHVPRHRRKVGARARQLGRPVGSVSVKGNRIADDGQRYDFGDAAFSKTGIHSNVDYFSRASRGGGLWRLRPRQASATRRAL